MAHLSEFENQGINSNKKPFAPNLDRPVNVESISFVTTTTNVAHFHVVDCTQKA